MKEIWNERERKEFPAALINSTGNRLRHESRKGVGERVGVVSKKQ